MWISTQGLSAFTSRPSTSNNAPKKSMLQTQIHFKLMLDPPLGYFTCFFSLNSEWLIEEVEKGAGELIGNRKVWKSSTHQEKWLWEKGDNQWGNWKLYCLRREGVQHKQSGIRGAVTLSCFCVGVGVCGHRHQCASGKCRATWTLFYRKKEGGIREGRKAAEMESDKCLLEEHGEQFCSFFSLAERTQGEEMANKAEFQQLTSQFCCLWS